MLRRNLGNVILVLVMVGLFAWTFKAAAEQESKDTKVFQESERFVEVLRLVQKQYVRDVDTKKLFQDAINGMLSGLDPFSNYIPEDELTEFNKNIHGKFGGIGIQIGMRNGILTVISPLEGTPAYRAGVMAGDLILEIEGKSTEKLRLDEAVKVLTGDPGTKVRIKVRHMTGENADITITREIIEVHTVKGVKRDDKNEWVYMLDNDKKIGYVRLTSFVEKSTEELRKAMDSLQKEGAKAFILDLRFNPGGVLQTAVEVCDMFVDKGIIVQTKGRVTPYWEATATHDNKVPYMPMVVLVNQFSASASEIVSGCLQDHHRAIIIGERSFGKGSVQNVIPLEGEKAALKLTTSKYYLPSGRNIHRDEDMTDKDEWGVVPDIIVPMTPEEYVSIIRQRQDAEVMKATGGATSPTGTGGDKDKKDAPKGDAPKSDAPKSDKPKAEPTKLDRPKIDPSSGDLDEELPAGTATGTAAAAKKPAEDRQLQRAVDVLKSVEIIEKYLKKEPVKTVEPRKPDVAVKKAA
jgi:carboxyl-terminal processing protease